MKLGDLTPRQKYNLLRRLKKNYKEFLNAHHLEKNTENSYRHGFNDGVKATLEQQQEWTEETVEKILGSTLNGGLIAIAAAHNATLKP